MQQLVCQKKKEVLVKFDDSILAKCIKFVEFILLTDILELYDWHFWSMEVNAGLFNTISRLGGPVSFSAVSLLAYEVVYSNPV